MPHSRGRPDRDDFAPCTCGDPEGQLVYTRYGHVCAGCAAYVEARDDWEGQQEAAEYERDER